MAPAHRRGLVFPSRFYVTAPSTDTGALLERARESLRKTQLLEDLGEASAADVEEAEAQVRRFEARQRREKLATAEGHAPNTHEVWEGKAGEEAVRIFPPAEATVAELDAEAQRAAAAVLGDDGAEDAEDARMAPPAVVPPTESDSDGVLVDEASWTGEPFSLDDPAEAPARAETVDAENHPDAPEAEPLVEPAAPPAEDKPPTPAPLAWRSIAGAEVGVSKVLTAFEEMDAALEKDPERKARALAMSDLEHKAGVESIDYLFFLQRKLDAEYAELEALFGGGSETASADYRRKQHRNGIAARILVEMRDDWERREPTRKAEHEADQAELKAEKRKVYRPQPMPQPSEAMLERLASADPEHVAFCDRLELQRIRHIHLKTVAGQLATRLKAREQGISLFTAERRNV
jgi:hypothetical protein